MPGASHRPVIALLMAGVLLAGCGGAATTSAPAATSPTATDLSTPALAETAPVWVVTPPQPSTPSSAPSTAVAPTSAPTAAPMVSPPPGVGDYVVVAGDTLRDIAQRYDLTVEELIAANDPAPIGTATGTSWPSANGSSSGGSC